VQYNTSEATKNAMQRNEMTTHKEMIQQPDHGGRKWSSSMVWYRKPLLTISSISLLWGGRKARV
jgi:hypothetical protein